MKNETRLIAHTDNILFGYWDADKEEFIELRILNSSEEMDVAEKFGCSPLLVEALITLTESIAEAVGQDLKDIWKKLEQ